MTAASGASSRVRDGYATEHFEARPSIRGYVLVKRNSDTVIFGSLLSEEYARIAVEILEKGYRMGMEASASLKKNSEKSADAHCETMMPL